MEDSMPVGGDNIGVDSKFLHELVDTFTEKLSIGAVESDELQSTHCLCTGTQYLLHGVGVAIAFCTVYVERPFSGLLPESATTYVQSVKRGAGHQADGLNLEVFHPDFLVLFIIEVEFDNSFYSFTEDVQRYILIR